MFMSTYTGLNVIYSLIPLLSRMVHITHKRYFILAFLWIKLYHDKKCFLILELDGKCVTILKYR